MALGLGLMIGGGYLAVMIALWYPLYAALEEARLASLHRRLPHTFSSYEHENGSSIAAASIFAMFWPIALIPLLSIRFWTGHWIPSHAKETADV